MHPFLLQIGSFRLPAYGFMVALGYTAAILYLYKSRDAALITRDQEADLIFYPALAGILGAKAVYAATYWTDLGPGPGAISKLIYVFTTFPYGFVFYGGFVAGAAAFFFYCRRNKLDSLKIADRFAPALSLAHGFGRIGCFLAGCCHGHPAGSAAFSIAFTDPMCEAARVYPGVPLHPVQLYESAGNFLIFGGLLWLSRRDKALPGGMVFAVYILAYAVLRFMTEFLRGDDRGGAWLGLSPAQTVSVLAAAAAVFILLKMRTK
jgi:phosphatidylglycerol:prolipoprotein diacylglycerol transferase